MTTKDWVTALLELAGIFDLGLTKEDVFSITLHKFVYNAKSSPMLEVKYFVCDEHGRVEEIRTITKILDAELPTFICKKEAHQEMLFEEGKKIHP